MEPVRLPSPDEIKPGATFRDKGSVIELGPGKYGDTDLQVKFNGRPPSHQIIAVLLASIYVAEERYKGNGGQGGEYFAGHVKTWLRRIRDEINGQENLFD